MQRKEISFKGQKVFIGIDVHKDSWRVAIAPEVGVVKGHSQKPSARELLDFLKKYYPDGVRIRFQRIFDLLCAAGCRY